MVSSFSASSTPSYDFLVSYAPADRAWAEWISWVLEAHKYKVFLDAWDIRAGQNFILEKDRALRQTKQVLILLSPDYINDDERMAEWTVAFLQDPSGEKRTLIPIVIRESTLTGLLGPRIPIILINLDESQSEDALLKGILSGERGKLSVAPLFPPISSTKKDKAISDHDTQLQEPPFPQDYAPITRPVRAFIICSNTEEDQRLLQNFLTALALMQSKGIIQTWNSNNLLPGQSRRDEISKQIKQADIILPLISSDFFNDSECSELAKLAFAGYQQHDGRILPILLRPCIWQESDYRALTVLPDNQVELTKWSNLDEGLLNIASGIKKVVDSLVLKKDS